ncbi:MAG: hypothetical protein ACRD0M_07765, partial [Acidimicrobiales bacterium]
MASANKLVVERRLKGAGRPGARQHVNPMAAVRAMTCSDRWLAAWPQMARQVRHPAEHGRRRRPLSKRPVKGPVALPTLLTPPPVTLSTTPAQEAALPPPHPPSSPPAPRKITKGPY